MNDLQVTKNALRVINEIINTMGNSDNWVSHGICGQVNSQMEGMFDANMKHQIRKLIKEITQAWPHYSGDATYPVPASIDGSNTREPGNAFTSACAEQNSKDALWSHGNAYGRARWRLLRYIRNTLNEKIEAALNTHTNINANAATASENEQANTDIDTNTLQGKIAVMQAFQRGETIEFSYHYENNWQVPVSPTWDWSKFEYRIQVKAKVKDTFDFAGLNQNWKYAARDKDDNIYVYQNEPIIDHLCECWSNTSFHNKCNDITDLFISYKVGDVDWKDSLISRDEVQSMPRHIADLLRHGQFFSAIKEHRQHYGTDLREAKNACHDWRVANVNNWQNI